MPGINQVTILGNVGKDPEIRSMNSGDKVANFSIATSEKWKDKSSGEDKEKTDWHNIVVWGPLVNVIEKYVHKGSKIYVQGKLQTRKWQDQSGADRYSTEVVLQGFNARLELLDGKRSDGEARGGGGGYAEPEKQFENDLSEDIPFATNRSIW